jgi:hypothetical protein
MKALLGEAAKFLNRVEAAGALLGRLTRAAKVDHQPAIEILPYATACDRILHATTLSHPTMRSNEASGAVSTWRQQTEPGRYTPIA